MNGHEIVTDNIYSNHPFSQEKDNELIEKIRKRLEENSQKKAQTRSSAITR